MKIHNTIYTRLRNREPLIAFGFHQAGTFISAPSAVRYPTRGASSETERDKEDRQLEIKSVRAKGGRQTYRQINRVNNYYITIH